ncbi:MAG: ComEC/Rec2 family competence protein [Patescibacteria group bacterium]|nr:ComEC/Rec2 family competence protein [Patescibacteria group bacterium]
MFIPNKKLFYVFLGLISIVCFLIFSLNSSKNDLLKVYFLDVGQGDSILIQTPAGQDILIDGGPGKAVINELDKHMSFWNRDIELMILTHPHADHVNGLVEVLKIYEVDQVLGFDIDYNSSTYKQWQKLIKEKEIDYSETLAGDKFILSKNLYLETLYPFEDITGQEFEDLNDASIVNRLCYFEHCFLFTGDNSKEIEKKLIANNLTVKADVLKVGHHGSKYSSDRDFIKKVNPAYAIIQCGQDNRFDHPHEAAIERLNDQDIEILRNDKDGEIFCQGFEEGIKCNRSNGK